MKTISISEDLYKELIYLKLEQRNKSLAEVIMKLIICYKKQKFLLDSEKC